MNARPLAVAALIAPAAWLAPAAAQSTRPVAVAPDVVDAIRAADHAGQLLSVPGLPLGDDALPVLDATVADAPGPQLLFSDKPEYFRSGDGVAMREEIEPGDYRLYLYHVPTPDAGPKHVTATVENLGDAPMTLRFTDYARPPVGGDYHDIGKQGLVGLLTPGLPTDAPAEIATPRTVAPGQTVLLDPTLAGVAAQTDQLVHGLYEFTVDQPAVVSTLQTSPGVDPTEAVDTLPRLPQVLPGQHPSGAGRGRFPSADKLVTIAAPIDTSAGPVQLIVADGVRDPWVRGVDSMGAAGDGPPEEPTQNKGNYGVVYRLRLPYASPDGRGVAVLTYNARAAGKWCDYQASAVRTFSADDDAPTPGLLPTADLGVVPIPADAVRYGGPPEAVLIQTYPPAAPGETNTVELLYSPPGASCLPTPIVVVPYGP